LRNAPSGNSSLFRLRNSFRHRALGYFLHSDRVRRQTADGFLQTSLSKILGDRDPASTSIWLASDFRSTLAVIRPSDLHFPNSGLSCAICAVRLNLGLKKVRTSQEAKFNDHHESVLAN